MNINIAGSGSVILVIAMALVTLITRWGGVWIMSFVPLNRRITSFIHGMSGAVLVAILAPVAVTGDKGAQLALLTTTLLMLIIKRPLIAIISGIVVCGLVRHV